MLYDKRQDPAYGPDKEAGRRLFKEPSAEYRGTPFWAWNGKLSKEELARQIEIFHQMGFGGFHMHVRTGLSTPYLSEEFMEAIAFCIEEAEKRGMLAYLYDEDRWPSGSAGGKVTRDHPERAKKSLLFTTKPYHAGHPEVDDGEGSGENPGTADEGKNRKPRPGYGQEAVRQENGELLAVYEIELREDGTLLRYRCQPCGGESGGAAKEQGNAAEGSLEKRKRRWYAYAEHASEDPWFNNAAYVDTLNMEAVRAFLDSTHEIYASHVGRSFGHAVRTIFTDEPQYMYREPLPFSKDETDIIIPWTSGLEEIYKTEYREDLLEKLPELFFELPEKSLSGVRWRFTNLLTNLFVANFCETIGHWCAEHGLSLTGHVMNEPTLFSQTQAVGDAMRCYEAFGIPGIDMLCDFHEFTTAKQTASRVRQLGKEGMLSELYGVTGWDCDFRTYKLQGDWQAALGVTLRVPHLAWMTMKGEAKRDYPASISFQSPWYTEYKLIEDHFARVGYALTRGRALSRVAVLHPVESYWLLFGPEDKTRQAREAMDGAFTGLAQTLLKNLLDFDYVHEDGLMKEGGVENGQLAVGRARYDAVIVPAVLTLRKSTARLLRSFAEAGGTVLLQGEKPSLLDASPVTEAADLDRLYEKGVFIGENENLLLEALEPFREIDIRLNNGRRTENLLYMLREEEKSRWLFVAHSENPESPHVSRPEEVTLRIRGRWKVELWDTRSGEIGSVESCLQENDTLLEAVLYAHDSLLLRLIPEREEGAFSAPLKNQAPKGTVSLAGRRRALFLREEPDIYLGEVPVSLNEPNVLLLDMAEYAAGEEETFYSREEILRIDNIARQKLGIPLRRKEIVQPYQAGEEAARGKLRLKFRIHAEEKPEGPVYLALEDAAKTRIWLNEKEIKERPCGYYVDPAIEKVNLPPLKQGENVLEIACPVGIGTNLEAFYLLGDCGTRVQGADGFITKKVGTLRFGDITHQGLSFYTGNIDYHLKIRTSGEPFMIRVPKYRGGLVKVFLDGHEAGALFMAPYALELSAEPGEHDLTLRLYGTRQNGFGQLHHTQGVYFYQSPNSWRSSGDLWTYEYQFREAGILSSPELYGASFIVSGGGSRKAAAGERVEEHS